MVPGGKDLRFRMCRNRRRQRVLIVPTAGARASGGPDDQYDLDPEAFRKTGLWGLPVTRESRSEVLTDNRGGVRFSDRAVHPSAGLRLFPTGYDVAVRVLVGRAAAAAVDNFVLVIQHFPAVVEPQQFPSLEGVYVVVEIGRAPF